MIKNAMIVALLAITSVSCSSSSSTSSSSGSGTSATTKEAAPADDKTIPGSTPVKDEVKKDVPKLQRQLPVE